MEVRPGLPVLQADCSQCFALCCVAPAFSASADFAISKPAGKACRNLQPDFRCGIHSALRQQGFSGCTAYDCFGAGQHVSQGTFGGTDWRTSKVVAQQMFAVFPVMRQLHELLWYVEAALSYPAAATVHPALLAMRDATLVLTALPAEDLVAADLTRHRDDVNALLVRASDLVRAPAGRRARQLRGADLVGAKLAGADLRGANLRGALLVGAELAAADLRLADLTGADLRAADVTGADLSGCLFLTQSQVEAAVGDATTSLPAGLSHPQHWQRLAT